MRLPEDVIILIVRWATATATDALETDPGCTHPVARSAMTFALEETMATKLALSLVSRTLHAIIGRLLYEVAAVYDPRRILPLVAALRGPCPFSRQPHGHYCRRLDVDILYDEDDWSHGAASLWGALQACPNLEILNISICANGQGASVDSPVVGSYQCPLSLLVQIAELYGPRLRRFELRGDVCVHVAVVNYMLSRCPALQVLCVPGMFALSHHLAEGEHTGASVPDDVVIMRKNRLKGVQKLMIREERDIFAKAMATARVWRAICCDVPRSSALHSLELGNYADLACSWGALPALKTLHISFRHDWHYSGDYSDQEEHALVAAVLDSFGGALSAWTYCDPSSEVCALIRMCPHLEYMALLIRGEPDLAHVAHNKLCVLDLLVASELRSCWAWTECILNSVRTGSLPALRELRIVKWDSSASETPDFARLRGAFAVFGVSLRVGVGDLLSGPIGASTVRQLLRQAFMIPRTVFHIPALITQHRVSIPDVHWNKRTIKYFADAYPLIAQKMQTYRAYMSKCSRNACKNRPLPDPI